MYQTFSSCNNHGDDSQHLDYPGSLCWPIVSQQHPIGHDTMQTPRRAPGYDVDWPATETWRRNTNVAPCAGQDRCLENPQTCIPKYLFGVDDVGPCPSERSCKNSYRCAPCPQACSYPCPAVPGCNRLTTRCFDWPMPHRERCAATVTSLDLRRPRAELNLMDYQPQRCPTCKRLVVDMACGPLSYNY